MSKDKTYILRRPIKAKRMNSENWRDIFEVDMPASWDAEQSITYELQEDDFNKTFVELDENATRKQIEKLIQTHDYVQAANQPMESNWDLEVTSFAEQIVLLLLNQEGERHE